MSTLSINKPAMTLEQQRSKFAWDSIQGCNKDYVKLAKSAPALIMNNGLMQTLAFYQDKNKPHHQALASHLRRWIMVRAGGADKDPGFQSLMGELLKFDSRQYRQATEEALLLLRWIRQFAAALGG